MNVIICYYMICLWFLAVCMCCTCFSSSFRFWSSISNCFSASSQGSGREIWSDLWVHPAWMARLQNSNAQWPWTPNLAKTSVQIAQGRWKEELLQCKPVAKRLHRMTKLFFLWRLAQICAATSPESFVIVAAWLVQSYDLAALNMKSETAQNTSLV